MTGTKITAEQALEACAKFSRGRGSYAANDVLAVIWYIAQSEREITELRERTHRAEAALSEQTRARVTAEAAAAKMRAVIESRDTVRLRWEETRERHRSEVATIAEALTDCWDPDGRVYRGTELERLHARLRSEVDATEPKPDQHDRKTYCERCREVTLCRSIPSTYDGTYWRCLRCAQVVEP